MGPPLVWGTKVPFSSITINALYKLSEDEDDEFESLLKNPNCNTISETLMGKG